MRFVSLVLASLWICAPTLAADSYFELRSNANAYSEPDRRSHVVTKLQPGADGKLYVVRWLDSAKKNGYYYVEIPGTPKRRAWVYKSFLRGYIGIPDDASISPHLAMADVASFGACKTLFVGGKPPIAPDEIVPLCEEEQGVQFFASGYSKSDNHGYWSAYRLDEEQIQEMNDNPRDRPNMKFRQNPKLEDGTYIQPRHDSYTLTGWDRGHLAPNGAMAWDEEAQKRSFSISNIAPQKPGMNRNIWRCFEYSIREWAANSGDTYVVVGAKRGNETISSDRDPNGREINVPSDFFAMVYRTKPKPQALGVMVPNEEGHLDIRKYVMSVKELEKKTNYSFSLPVDVAAKEPDLRNWPTRIVKKELLGKLPKIDAQCPRVAGG